MHAIFAMRFVSIIFAGYALSRLFLGNFLGASFVFLLAAIFFVASTVPGRVWWTSSGLPLVKRGGQAFLAHLMRHPSPWLQGLCFTATILLWVNAFLEKEASWCFNFGILTCLAGVELCLYYHRMEKKVHGAMLKHWPRTWLALSLFAGVVIYLNEWEGRSLLFAAISAGLALVTCFKGAWTKLGNGYMALVTGKKGWDVACMTIAISSLVVSAFFAIFFENSEHLETVSGMGFLFPALLLAIGMFVVGAVLFIRRLSNGDAKPFPVGKTVLVLFGLYALLEMIR